MAASSSASACACACVALLAACVLAGEGARAAQLHQVGGAPGWSLPSLSNVNYTVWAASQAFAVGDTLYFNYSSEYHNVVQLANESDYVNCVVSNPLHTWADGATNVTLSAAGTFYFACSIDTHCGQGQKLAVTVATSSPSNSTSSKTPASPAASLPRVPPLILLSQLAVIMQLVLSTISL